MTNEESDSYVRKAVNSLDPSKIDKDKSGLMTKYMELAEILNPMLPRSTMDQGSALDGINDDEPTVLVTATDADEMFSSPSDVAKATPVADAPIVMNIPTAPVAPTSIGFSL